jgi:hypothetical protein
VDYLSDLSATANKFDAELVKATRPDERSTGSGNLETGSREAEAGRRGPAHVTLCIDDDLTSQEFESNLFGGKNRDFGIIGLHTCGDLGLNLVTIYVLYSYQKELIWLVFDR